MMKFIIGIAVVAVLATGGYYVWEYMQNTPQEQQPTETPPVSMATTTYATSTFSIVYPADFTANDSYQYEGVPNKPIDGVKFTIPMTMATGTNLSSSDTGVSIEWLPRAQRCTGDIFIYQNVKATSMTDNGVAYSVSTTSGAGAGNLYEEHVYALPSSSPCIAVRYLIHSTNIGNYEPGAVREFDKPRLLELFDSIRRSLSIK